MSIIRGIFGCEARKVVRRGRCSVSTIMESTFFGTQISLSPISRYLSFHDIVGEREKTNFSKFKNVLHIFNL